MHQYYWRFAVRIKYFFLRSIIIMILYHIGSRRRSSRTWTMPARRKALSPSTRRSSTPFLLEKNILNLFDDLPNAMRHFYVLYSNLFEILNYIHFKFLILQSVFCTRFPVLVLIPRPLPLPPGRPWISWKKSKLFDCFIMLNWQRKDMLNVFLDSNVKLQ